MILIADSGSTKTEWMQLENDCAKINNTFVTSGINPVLQSEKEIIEEVTNNIIPRLNSTTTLNGLYFYGAGCLPEKVEMMKNIFSSHFTITGNIEVNSDMLGTARSLCGNKAGIACVLGTGSNSCFYDGKKIAANVPPLGYILGDEGSGAALGKQFVADLLKNQLSPELKEKFLSQHQFTQAEIIDRVYRKPFPNRFLAGFSPFIKKHINEPEVYNMVLNNFKLFINRNVKQYDYKKYKVGFNGSIAYSYKEILQEAARETGIDIGDIIAKPIEGLMKYHRMALLEE